MSQQEWTKSICKRLQLLCRWRTQAGWVWPGFHVAGTLHRWWHHLLYLAHPLSDPTTLHNVPGLTWKLLSSLSFNEVHLSFLKHINIQTKTTNQLNKSPLKPEPTKISKQNQNNPQTLESKLYSFVKPDGNEAHMAHFYTVNMTTASE
jgi:hypothetical protein